MSRKRVFIWILAICLCLCTVGCSVVAAYRATDLCITIVDVADGDCILITAPNGQAMMIDTGLPDHRNDVADALAQAGVQKLDALILTHPHNDHIGNAVWVMQNYQVSMVYQIDVKRDTAVYRELEDYLQNSGIPKKFIRMGDTFAFSDAACRFLGPVSVNTQELNDASAVLRMDYRGKSFLFMGDAQWDAEALLMTTSKQYLDADFLKVGHHALHSTSTAFLKAVTPSIACISMANPNISDDPQEHRDNIANIAKYAQELYRTDQNGDVLIRYDGKNIMVQTQK